MSVHIYVNFCYKMIRILNQIPLNPLKGTCVLPLGRWREATEGLKIDLFNFVSLFKNYP